MFMGGVLAAGKNKPTVSNKSTDTKSEGGKSTGTKKTGAKPEPPPLS